MSYFTRMRCLLYFRAQGTNHCGLHYVELRRCKHLAIFSYLVSFSDLLLMKLVLLLLCAAFGLSVFHRCESSLLRCRYLLWLCQTDVLSQLSYASMKLTWSLKQLCMACRQTGKVVLRQQLFGHDTKLVMLALPQAGISEQEATDHLWPATLTAAVGNFLNAHYHCSGQSLHIILLVRKLNDVNGTHVCCICTVACL